LGYGLFQFCLELLLDLRGMLPLYPLHGPQLLLVGGDLQAAAAAATATHEVGHLSCSFPNAPTTLDKDALLLLAGCSWCDKRADTALSALALTRSWCNMRWNLGVVLSTVPLFVSLTSAELHIPELAALPPGAELPQPFFFGHPDPCGRPNNVSLFFWEVPAWLQLCAHSRVLHC